VRGVSGAAAQGGCDVTGPRHGLRVVRSASLTSLADHLADHLITAPPRDPFASVEVVVPSRGVERWLTQRLSTRLGATAHEAGVCANVTFPFLGGVVERILAATLGGEPGDVDPWSPERLAWPLLALLDDLPTASAFEPLRLHLVDGGAPALRRRFPLARRIADLFDRYALYRPDMVMAWRRGEDVDGSGTPLAANLAWQPPLWRRLSAELAVESPDRRTTESLRRLRRGEVQRAGDLPGSVTVFGVLALPPRQLELLAALSRTVPVTLYTHAPCPAWATHDAEPSPSNPLLAASGGRAREAHTILAPHLGDAMLLPVPDGAGATVTALGVVQEDIRRDLRRGVGRQVPPLAWSAGDDSLQVHACHGPLRQLEVLREVLLGLLEDDPTLEPRDIAVLTPDVEAYASIVSAAFPRRQRDGADADEDEPADLPVVVADRTVPEDDAVGSALLAVLELATARVTASQVLDLLAMPPVRTTFSLSAGDLGELQRWLLDTGVSWGIDAEHRRELIDLTDDAHTWAAGLDRWTLGAAMADDGTRLVGDVLPYDEVEGDGVELLGRVTAALEAVFATIRSLARPRPIAAWRDTLAAAVTSLLDPGPGPSRGADLSAELMRVRGMLDTLVDDAAAVGGGSSTVELSLEEIRGIIGARLLTGAGAASTGTGAITLTGLVPLRNVPHRVVCLVGMDDGALPRAGAQHGFDLLGAPSRPGDPDPRLEERQLFLDAVLAATEHLVITYSGHDPRTNERLQPAVPVSELLDVVDASFVGPVPVVHSQPLQPHSARYFRDPAPGEEPVLRAFDPHHLAAARAALRATGPAPGFLSTPLPPPSGELAAAEVIELDDLIRFLEHPVRFLLQRRLGLSLGADDRRLPDRDPTELGGLERWRLGQELLSLRLAGLAPERWRTLTMATGTAPVGGLGEVALQGIEELVDRVLARVDAIAGDRQLRSIELGVPVTGADVDSARLAGSVELVGRTVLHAGVSRLKAKHRLAAWVRTLSVLVSDPELRPEAVLIGGDTSRTAGVRELGLEPLAGLATRTATAPDAPPAPDELAELARAHLGELVSLYLRGHQEVLPLVPETAAAYATARADGADHAGAIAAAHRRAWVGNGVFGGDRDDPYIVQAFGRDTELLAIDVEHPLGVAAELLWGPLLAAQVRR
jgi:exodeoxyribonuclease V gamma subunit